ncbi:hypothetical protein Bealeia1_01367 [Candidatus Bealeia paramacronuclearis]|uniref:Uncharacterized protein n=1 Tax=Candidatus Bealeia paramacronuclearis TaxID=1921001 RepID=A0ABZ2C941_9PROT|nr:hypothetical protein [Candidatus Bealeia paramacronuclearis]
MFINTSKIFISFYLMFCFQLLGVTEDTQAESKNTDKTFSTELHSNPISNTLPAINSLINASLTLKNNFNALTLRDPKKQVVFQAGLEGPNAVVGGLGIGKRHRTRIF